MSPSPISDTAKLTPRSAEEAAKDQFVWLYVHWESCQRPECHECSRWLQVRSLLLRIFDVRT